MNSHALIQQKVKDERKKSICFTLDQKLKDISQKQN